MQTRPNLAMFFCRHLIAVVATVKDRAGQIQSDASTFFVLEIRGVWFLATAGHVLKKMLDIAASPHFESADFRLFDSWQGMLSTESVAVTHPFNLRDAQPFWQENDDEGIDVGLLMVPDFLRRSLESRGIVGMAEPMWDFASDVPFDGHALLGLPSELIELRGQKLGFQPILFPVQECPAPEVMLKPTERFHGRIGLRGSNLKGLDGVSGGPILGLRKVDGEYRYYLVAIQSVWRRELNVISGNFVFGFAAELANALALDPGQEAG